MKTLPITKVFNEGDRRYVEVRDYLLYKSPVKIVVCKGTPKTCYHQNEEYMELSVAQQHDRGKFINTQRSKFYPYKLYRMVRFLFNPDGIIQGLEFSDKDFEFKGNTAYLKN